MRRSNRYEDTVHHRAQAVHLAGRQDARGLDRAQRGGVALRFAGGTGVSPNPSNRVPDVINYAWREYGMRVGLWRIADVLDAAGVKATVALNSQCLRDLSQGHGRNEEARLGVHGPWHHQQRKPAGLAPEKEKEVIRHVLKTIEQATGKQPRGWLGTGLTQTYNTLDILAEEGVTYCGDWNNDDQPYPMKVKSGKMYCDPLLHGDQRHPALHPKRLHRRAVLPLGDGPVRAALRRQRQAAARHGHSTPSDDHGPAVAHQISASARSPR